VKPWPSSGYLPYLCRVTIAGPAADDSGVSTLIDETPCSRPLPGSPTPYPS
jgi:hypothetical protein